MTSAIAQEDPRPRAAGASSSGGRLETARLLSTSSDPAPMRDHASLGDARGSSRRQQTSRWLPVLVYGPASAIEVDRDHDTVLRSSRSAVGGKTRSTSSSVVRPSRSLAMASVAIE
jgi:hypothetical protein